MITKPVTSSYFPVNDLEVKPPQCAERPLGDLVHRAGGVDAEENALVGIEGDQRGRLFLVDLETMPDGLLTVIVTLEKLTAAVVARIDVRGRIEQRVPDPAASTAGPPAGQPPHHLIVIHNEFQDHVEPGLPGREQLLERLSLRHGPGEAVQQESR